MVSIYFKHNIWGVANRTVKQPNDAARSRPVYADFIILVETSAPAAMAKTVATTKVSGPYTESLPAFFVFPPFGLCASSIS